MLAHNRWINRWIHAEVKLHRPKSLPKSFWRQTGWNAPADNKNNAMSSPVADTWWTRSTIANIRKWAVDIGISLIVFWGIWGGLRWNWVLHENVPPCTFEFTCYVTGLNRVISWLCCTHTYTCVQTAIFSKFFTHVFQWHMPFSHVPSCMLEKATFAVQWYGGSHRYAAFCWQFPHVFCKLVWTLADVDQYLLDAPPSAGSVEQNLIHFKSSELQRTLKWNQITSWDRNQQILSFAPHMCSWGIQPAVPYF